MKGRQARKILKRIACMSLSTPSGVIHFIDIFGLYRKDTVSKARKRANAKEPTP